MLAVGSKSPRIQQDFKRAIRAGPVESLWYVGNVTLRRSKNISKEYEHCVWRALRSILCGALIDLTRWSGESRSVETRPGFDRVAWRDGLIGVIGVMPRPGRTRRFVECSAVLELDARRSNAIAGLRWGAIDNCQQLGAQQGRKLFIHRSGCLAQYRLQFADFSSQAALFTLACRSRAMSKWPTHITFRCCPLAWPRRTPRGGQC